MVTPHSRGAEPRQATVAAPRLDGGTLIAACVAIAVAQVGVSLVAPIIGVIQADLGASVAALAWIPAAFILPTAILELNFGVLGDLFGRKRLLVAGGLLIAVGDAVAATAGTLPQLITGQAVAGLGAAAIFPSSLAVIVAATSDAAARARALSYWAISLAFGAMIAPLISGFATEQASWGWSFVAPAVFGLLTAGVSARWIVDSRQPAGRGLDWPGQVTIAVSLLALLYAVIQGATDGYSDTMIVIAFGLSLAAFVAFLVSESRARAPMLRLHLFRVPAFATATAIGLLALFGFIGTAYALSLKLESVLHVTPLRAALPFALIQAIPVLLTPFLPRLLQRVHPRVLLVTGLLALAAGQVWMALLPGDSAGLGPLTGPILLLGVGFITMFSALTAVAVGAVDIGYAGMASAVTSLVRETGQSLGPAIVGAVALGTAGHSLADRFASSDLAPDVIGAGTAVLTAGGPLAVANADLGPLSGTLAPMARAALEQGLDRGIYVAAGASLLGAVIAVVGLRHSGAADAPAGLQNDAELDGELPPPTNEAAASSVSRPVPAP